MATYIVAKRRESRGIGQSAVDAVKHLPDVRIKGASNPDLVVFEAPEDRLVYLRKLLEAHFTIEPEIKRKLL